MQTSSTEAGNAKPTQPEPGHVHGRELDSDHPGNPLGPDFAQVREDLATTAAMDGEPPPLRAPGRTPDRDVSVSDEELALAMFNAQYPHMIPLDTLDRLPNETAYLLMARTAHCLLVPDVPYTHEDVWRLQGVYKAMKRLEAQDRPIIPNSYEYDCILQALEPFQSQRTPTEEALRLERGKAAWDAWSMYGGIGPRAWAVVADAAIAKKAEQDAEARR